MTQKDQPQENIDRPASSLEETDEGSVENVGEETNVGMLSGEQPSAPDPGQGIGGGTSGA